MAKLHFNYATMNAGKSIDLIRTAYNYEENGFKVIVLKPLTDTKDGDYISSRAGLRRRADYLISGSIIEMLAGKLDGVYSILVDEAQFLDRNQVEELYLITKALDIPVITYGLRLNFKGEMFEGSKRLTELADELREIPTICGCGSIARMVGRQVNGEYVISGSEVVIDGSDDVVKYVPLCGKCYFKKVLKKDFKAVKDKLVSR